MWLLKVMAEKESFCFVCVFPQPVEDRRRVRAILPYTKVPDTDEIR